MGYDLGVDLGTTYTCAAIVRDGQVSVCQLGQSAQVIPSVISIRDDGTVLTGEAAARRAITDPARTVREFKRRFGDDAPFVIGGTPYGAEVLTARLLQAVVAQVSAHEGEPPTSVAISHPATWGPFKLDLLGEAVRLAGLTQPTFVSEPVAAAVAYAARHPQPESSYLLVYDLGGGTFDVAAVWFGATGPIVAGQPEGLARLGGADFDQAVLAHIDEALGGAVTALDGADPEARGSVARLRDDARSAKEALSSDTEAEIPVMLPTVRSSVRLTRAEFEHRIAPRLEDTIGVAERVLTSAGLVPAHLTAVLLVGGSSRVPLVAHVVRERLGVAVVAGVNPLFAVAEGAALVASATTTAATHQAVGPVAGSAAAVVAGSSDPPSAEGLVPPDATSPVDPTTETPSVAAGAPVGVGGASDSGGAASPSRRRTAIAALTLVVALVVLIGGIGYLLTRSGDTTVATFASSRGTGTTIDGEASTTVTTSPETTDPSSPETTQAGQPVTTTLRSNPPPTTTPQSTSSAKPTPTVTSINGAPAIICYGNPAPTSYELTVSWTTSNAVSVTVSRWTEAEVWEADSPANGSTTYAVQCEGRDEEKVIIIAKGADGSMTTKSLTIPIKRSPG